MRLTLGLCVLLLLGCGHRRRECVAPAAAPTPVIVPQRARIIHRYHNCQELPKDANHYSDGHQQLDCLESNEEQVIE